MVRQKITGQLLCYNILKLDLFDMSFQWKWNLSAAAGVVLEQRAAGSLIIIWHCGRLGIWIYSVFSSSNGNTVLFFYDKLAYTCSVKTPIEKVVQILWTLKLLICIKQKLVLLTGGASHLVQTTDDLSGWKQLFTKFTLSSKMLLLTIYLWSHGVVMWSIVLVYKFKTKLNCINFTISSLLLFITKIEH